LQQRRNKSVIEITNKFKTRISRIIIMNPKTMELHGVAFLDYFDGDASATITIQRYDGYESPLPVRFFFRELSEFISTDKAAIENCSDHVLDVGAGAGVHRLVKS
jgi:hypothetical protein